MDIRIKEVINNLKNYDFDILGNYKMDGAEAKKLIEAIEETDKKIADYTYMIGLLQDRIKEIEKSDKWIPCEVRLPEENGVYIVSYEDSVRLLEWFNEKWFFYPSNPAREETGTIIAWMPLPQPYKAERGMTFDKAMIHTLEKKIDELEIEVGRLYETVNALEQQNELFKKGATNKDVFKAVFGYEPATNDVVCNNDDWCGASEPCNYCICNPDKVGVEEDWWNAPYKTEREVTAITHYEAIKGMNEDALATFIMHLETGMCAIPKKYYCDETYCVNCKEHLSCYKNYLKSEVMDK